MVCRIPLDCRQNNFTCNCLNGETPSPLTVLHGFTLNRYFLASPANALCTSVRDIPNSRAIRAGVTPALNAARIAFNFPCGKRNRNLLGMSFLLPFVCHRRFFPSSPFFECYRNQPVELLIIEVFDRRIEVLWQNISWMRRLSFRADPIRGRVRRRQWCRFSPHRRGTMGY